MRAAARYYEERRRGLGDEFLSEVERAVTFAAERPEAGTPLGADLRWVLTRRFRYAVIYRERERGIEVLAVAHLRRRPGYWRSRV
jgi:plasmid stabilization system protein ParE